MVKQIQQLPNAHEQLEEKIRDRHFVTSLARGLEVLRVFQAGDGFLGNQEIAERTALPKPTVSRLTSTLTKLGYLEHDSRLKKYRLGSPILALGYAFLGNLDVRRVASPLMQELADYAAATVALCAKDRLSMLYIELCHGIESTYLRREVGARIPMHCSAAGIAFLAGSNKETRTYYMKQIEKQQKQDWRKVQRLLNKGIKEVETNGFCMVIGGVEPSVNAVAAPLVARDGMNVLSVNCTGPSFHLTEEKLLTCIGPRLVNMVSTIKADMARFHFQL
jgi:DNA-binding IclR family transcriptional regulator